MYNEIKMSKKEQEEARATLRAANLQTKHSKIGLCRLDTLTAAMIERTQWPWNGKATCRTSYDRATRTETKYVSFDSDEVAAAGCGKTWLEALRGSGAWHVIEYLALRPRLG